MEAFKSGFVSVIGRTNVGKSSLINELVGEKVAAVANKVQTTRTAIRGIVNRPNAQIVFVDTPGIHKPKTKLSDTMVETAFGTIGEVDLVVFVVEADSKEIGKGDSKILEKIQEAKKKTILVVNKIDLVSKEELAKVLVLYADAYSFTAVVPVSTTKKKGLTELLEEIEQNLKPGPAFYDTEEYTDQTLRQLAEEMVREKALKLLQDEVPHGILVEVQNMKSRKTKDKEFIYDVDVCIYCERESHKGIIIGQNGQMLKRIGTYAREDLEKMIGCKINLKLWVKVNSDWMNNESLVKKFKLQ